MTQIVGLNWHEITQDKTKDVIVKYYNTEDAESMKFSHPYAELAEKCKDARNIIVGLMEVTSNDVMGVDLPSKDFPIIMFYPMGDFSDKATEGYKIYFDERDFGTLPSLEAWLTANSPAYKMFFPSEKSYLTK